MKSGGKRRDGYTQRLFRNTSGQEEMYDKSLEEELEERSAHPITCLLLPFDSDGARRKHFNEKLKEYLADPGFRKIDGFPNASDDDIIALSDPPYYTACPNPFTKSFIETYSKPYDPSLDYNREPFTADVSEGKSHPIYNAHSYHTKGPHQAIMRYILHYTAPGDVIFDGFCGTGMAGVAAQMCGDKSAVQSLGYKVDNAGTIYRRETDETGAEAWTRFSQLGARPAILSDLSPAATFIAYNHNFPVDIPRLEHETGRILREVDERCGWMYQTKDDPASEPSRVNYIVWSDVFLCPDCSSDVVFFNVAVDSSTGEIKDSFKCQGCGSELTKPSLMRKYATRLGLDSAQPIQVAVQIPVLINYSTGGTRQTKDPSRWDFDLLARIDNTPTRYYYPKDRIDRDIDIWYERDYKSLGLNSLDSFYTKRNLLYLSELFHEINNGQSDVRRALKFCFTGTVQIASRMSSFRYDSRNPNNTAGGILKGALYIPSLSKEAQGLGVLYITSAWNRKHRTFGKPSRPTSSAWRRTRFIWPLGWQSGRFGR